MIIESIIAALCLGFLLGMLEWITTRYNIPKAHSRKAVHITSALLIVALCIVFDWKIFIYLGIIFFFALSILRYIHPLKSLSDRSHVSYGDVVFPVGVSLAALISTSEMDFITTILILGISDTLAYYIGTLFKSKTLINQKTLYGSLGFLVSSFILLLTVISPFSAFYIALILTLTEILSTKGLDNLSVPVLAAILLAII